jgi:hypothetical protein
LRSLVGVVRINFGSCIGSYQPICPMPNWLHEHRKLNMKVSVSERGNACGRLLRSQPKLLLLRVDGSVFCHSCESQYESMETGNRPFRIKKWVPVQRDSVSDTYAGAGIGDERNRPGLRRLRRLCVGTDNCKQAEAAKKISGVGRDCSSVVHVGSLLILAAVRNGATPRSDPVGACALRASTADDNPPIAVAIAH